ncbi:hypothetical protein HNP84_005612 [Thermocatellispora tengchongensis]|uniref:Uncharacterized protein n=1 Tax=Thermocatellispora tengchongensis TaxID=1073253 RepID=A0A840P874_9ACTN|nr:hypothetical protein [Thermocatellispora tengchongensis]MBB5135868.1 hypothetical protein [Thermocatellispora tengchongensis]
MSAGALALAIGGSTLVTAPAASAAVPVLDCDRGSGSGLVSGLASGVCDLVGEVTDAVDGLTGGALGPVTEPLDRTAETVLGGGDDSSTGTGTTGDLGKDTGKGEADKGGPAERETATPTPSAESSHGLLPKGLDEVCVPLVASPKCAEAEATSPPDKRPTPTPEPDRRRESRRTAAPLPIEPPRPPERGPRQVTAQDTEQTLTPDPLPIDLDEPRVDLLWPLTERLPVPMRVRPEELKPQRRSDTAGTALTAVLLLSAILAARIGYARRGRQEPSIPFEPVRSRSGRHRLA